MSKVAIFIDPQAAGSIGPQNMVPFDFRVSELYFRTNVAAADLPNPTDPINLSIASRAGEDLQFAVEASDRKFSVTKQVFASLAAGTTTPAEFKIELREEIGFVVKGGEMLSFEITGVTNPISYENGVWLLGEYQ